MSAIKLIPTSGGGSVSLSPPNSTSGADVTVTLPSTSQSFGKVLQVVSGVVTTTLTMAPGAGTWAEITSDMRASITPISATSKLIIQTNCSVWSSSHCGIRIYRVKNGTSTYVSPNASGAGGTYDAQRGNSRFYDSDGPIGGTISTLVQETAGDTTTRYYTPYWTGIGDITLGFNRYHINTTYETTSSYMVMEVAA